MNVLPLTDRYASAYADAVIAFLVSGTAHEVYFDIEAAEFRSHPLDAGMAPSDVLQYISTGWDQGLGDVGAEKNPKSPQFSENKLRYAIISAVAESAFGQQQAAYLVRAAESPEDYI